MKNHPHIQGEGQKEDIWRSKQRTDIWLVPTMTVDRHQGVKVVVGQ